MTTPHRDAETPYLATATDTISGRRINSFTFSAASMEDAREQGWRTAGRYCTPDIHVRVTRIVIPAPIL